MKNQENENFEYPEIKFRIFDKRFEKYAYGSSTYEQDREIYPHTYNLSAFFRMAAEGIFGDGEIAQSIGVKDKEGVELYLGDIIQLSNGIIFAIGKERYLEFYLYTDTELTRTETIPFIIGYKNFIRIGNILENPELLKKEIHA